MGHAVPVAGFDISTWGTEAGVGFSVAAESQLCGALISTDSVVSSQRPRLWQHLMGVPGQRRRGDRRRCRLGSLIGEPLI